MKIIDLLNKIANGEIITGDTIKYNGSFFRYSEGDFVEVNYKGEPSTHWLFANEIIDLRNLTDEVEILEEEKKIPEKLDEYEYDTANEILIIRKINEIIDYLKSKGE